MKKLMIPALLLLSACSPQAVDNIYKATNNMAQSVTCTSDKPEDQVECNRLKAHRAYMECIDIHDKYVCEPFREQAGVTLD